MAAQSEQTGHLGSLFETITGQSTVTEEQQNDRPVRVAEQTDESSVAAYVDAAARADGLDDAVQKPEQD